MIITHQQGRGKKVHLLIDGEYQITTDIDFWAENFIKDKSNITDEEWQDLVDKINYKKAINKCYDLLSRRDHSVKELKIKLLRTVDEVYAQKAVDKMLDLGYLDDEKYARNLLTHLVDNKKMSKVFIKQEMFKRGISADIVSACLEETQIDNVSNIVDLILVKYKNKLGTEESEKKVIAALMRKGYSYSDIKSAFHRIDNDEYV